jgi:hypothetical protein
MEKACLKEGILYRLGNSNGTIAGMAGRIGSKMLREGERQRTETVFAIILTVQRPPPPNDVQ